MQEDLWDGLLRAALRVRARGLAKRIFANSGVRTRQAAVSPLLEDVSGWSPSAGCAATRSRRPARQGGGGPGADRRRRGGRRVGLFAVCSCTGYATPGLDILLARDLGMVAGRAAALRGAHGLLRGVARARRGRRLRGRPRPPGDAAVRGADQPAPAAGGTRADIQQIVSHALFSDAAAAVVLGRGDGPGHGYAVS